MTVFAFDVVGGRIRLAVRRETASLWADARPRRRKRARRGGAGPVRSSRPEPGVIRLGCRSSAQKAPVPFGVPSPVGPSQPVRAVHHWAGLHEPLFPEVTSFSDEAWP